MLKKTILSFWKFLTAGDGLSAQTGRDATLAILTGLITGLVTAGFAWMINISTSLIQHFLQTHSPWIILLPPLGAVTGALLLKYLGHADKARGTDSAIYAYHHLGGHLTSTVIPVKSVASVLTVATGGSAGYEGPVTLLGAACGSTIARVLHLDTRTKRILMAAGLAAGIGALFRAPLAGAIFGAEIFYSSSDLEYEVVLPSFIASALAYTVFASFYGFAPIFTMPNYAFTHGIRLLPYLVLAVVVTFGARFYISFFRGTETWFKRHTMPFWCKPLLGGLAVGSLGWFFPEVLGTGYDIIRRALVAGDVNLASSNISQLPLHGFVLFFFLKAIATSFTVASGGSGGVFAPALVCGAALGAATGIFFQQILPTSLGVNPGAFALVGMAGFTAASIRIPLTSIVMVSEISGNHQLLLPTMWVCGIAFWLNNGWSLYRSQFHDRDSLGKVKEL